MSKFYEVKCKCGNVQKIFSHAASRIMCTKCNEVLAETAGGEAVILGEIVKEME